MLQILPAGATTPHSSPLIALSTPLELANPFITRPPTHNGSSSSLSQRAEATVTDVNAAEISSATQTSSGAVSAESDTEQIAGLSSEQVQELGTAIVLHDKTPAGHGDIADEHIVHRKMLQMSRVLAAAAHHNNMSSSGSSDELVRLKPSEKLKGMIASSSRAFGKPGK